MVRNKCVNKLTEKQTGMLIKLCLDSGYMDCFSIESRGREQIKLDKMLKNTYSK